MLLKCGASSMGKEDWKQWYQIQIHHRSLAEMWGGTDPMCCRVIPMCRWVMPHVLVSEGGSVVLTRTCHSAAQIGHTFSVGVSNRRRLFLPRVFQWPHQHWLWGRCRHTHLLEGWNRSPVVPLPRLRKTQSSETHFAQDQTKTRLLMRNKYWTFQLQTRLLGARVVGASEQKL